MAKKQKKSDEQEIKIPGHSTQYDYVLSWIQESFEQRIPLMNLTNRAVKAYQGEPSRNRYSGLVKEYVDYIRKIDPDKASEISDAYKEIPTKNSMVVHNAVETLVSMTQGGVGQYEFGPFDAGSDADDKMMDYLASAAKFFYMEQKVDSILPQLIRSSVLGGMGAMHLSEPNDDGKICITLLSNERMVLDPKRSRTNRERFIGHTERTSFKTLKKQIIKKKDGYLLKTINEAEVYLRLIKGEINSVLTASSLNSAPMELRRDLDLFYKPLQMSIQDRRKEDPDYMYDGDDVEVIYLYDSMKNMFFTIVNRRYIVEAKKSPLKRSIKVKFLDREGEKKESTKVVKLDHPYVELPFTKTFWDSYPVSPLFYVLDDFDDLCAMESLLYHTLSIMAPLTFVGQSSDAEKVSRTASISGEVVEGLPQTFGVLNKTHDVTPIITAIQRIEEKIKRTLKAVDPFELQAMIGDRASAKEVSSASGQVAQGVGPFIANIETAMATLGDKFFKMKVIFGKDKIPFTHEGKYAELEIQEAAIDYNIVAKLQSSIKLEQEMNARRAVELVQFLNGNEAVNQQQFLGTMIPIALNSLINREQAKNMINPEYRPLPDETISMIRRNEEIRARQDEADKINLDGYTDEELAEIEAAFLTGNSQAIDPFQAEQQALSMAGAQVPQGQIDPTTGAPIDPLAGIVPQELTNPAADPMAGAPSAIPGTPESGGEVYNDPANFVI